MCRRKTLQGSSLYTMNKEMILTKILTKHVEFDLRQDRIATITAQSVVTPKILGKE